MINSNLSTYLGHSVSWVVEPSWNPVVGQMYFDSVCNGIRVYDGTGWVQLSTLSANYLAPTTIEELCKIHPGLEELKKELDEAQKKFEVYLALVKENNE